VNQYNPSVYILASKYHGVLYTGISSNLPHRIWQHRHKLVNGFSRQYNVDRLVWFEFHEDIVAAITREKQIKKWNIAWKIEMIEAVNPDWRDRYEEILG
jgi:putative endonuclease